MTLYLWGGSMTSTVADLLTNVKLNTYYGLLKGQSGSEDSVVLAYYAGDGALTFQPTSAPVSPNKSLMVKSNTGTLLSYIRSDGMALIGATVQGALTIQPTVDPSAGQQLFQLNNAAGVPQVYMTAGGGILAKGTASLGLVSSSGQAMSTLIVSGTASVGTLTTQTDLSVGGTASINIVSGGTGLFSGTASVNGLNVTTPMSSLMVNGTASIATANAQSGIVSGTASINTLSGGTARLSGTASINGINSAVATLAGIQSTGVNIARDDGFYQLQIARAAAPAHTYGLFVDPNQGAMALDDVTNATRRFTLFPTGGLVVGAGFTDPGATNLRVLGRISSSTVGVSTQTLLNFVPIDTNASYLTSASGNNNSGRVALALTGLPSSATMVSVLVRFYNVALPAGAILTLQSVSGSSFPSVEVLMPVAGQDVWATGNVVIANTSPGQIQYQTLNTGGAAWNLQIYITGYWEPA